MSLSKYRSYSRRSFIKSSTALATGLSVMPLASFVERPTIRRSSMGVAASSYANRWRADKTTEVPGFENALQMLKHCESIGAGGVQVGARNWSQDFTGKVRDFREEKGLYLEGSISLPKSDSDLERFKSEAKNSMEAGATILRTVCLHGRRYEDFDTDEAFKQFKQESIKSLERAIPIIKQYKLKLALENHKDWRVPDLLALLEYFDDESLGVNLDTGNNISFLENPMDVIESLAPYSFTTHLKDMGVQDYQDGFLLSEVPLGTGKLDLLRIVDICKKFNPDIKFNLEMITRNPLKVPCYTEAYWVTFNELSGSQSIKGLKWVRDHQSEVSLPTVDGMTVGEKLEYEEQNILESFNYAIEELHLVN